MQDLSFLAFLHTGPCAGIGGIGGLTWSSVDSTGGFDVFSSARSGTRSQKSLTERGVRGN